MPTCEQLTVSSLTPELTWRQRSLTELPEEGWACFRYPFSRRTRRLRGWGVILEQVLGSQAPAVSEKPQLFCQLF